MKIVNQFSTSIKIPNQNTTYIVGCNLLDNLSKLDCFKSPGTDTFLLLTDQNLFGLYGKRILDSLQKTGKGVVKAVVPDGEISKCLTTVESVCKTFLENKASRKSILVTLGGGVITDLGGFIGSILFRGISVIHLPTTLLAQIDAAIGGKNAVDVNVCGNMIKNMIGKIEQPYAVISDVNFLSTLPKNEIINGLGEAVKYWAGFGKPTYAQISSVRNQINTASLEEVILACLRIKLDVIQRDPFDTLGFRVRLNLGHTIGHAIEGYMKGKLSHGECVALGLVGAVKISSKMGILNNKTSRQIIAAIKDLGLPVAMSGLNIEKVICLLNYDKKGGSFVLLKDIGNLITGVIVENNIIRKVLSEIIL